MTDAHVWPASAVVGADGAMRVAGVDLRELAAEHGTPAYVLDEADLRARARAWREAWVDALGAADVYYAGKAFLSVAVARWVHDEGLRIDTATGGELAVALRAGVPGEAIGLHGNNKSDAELVAARDAGVGRVVIDSMAEIDRVAAVAADGWGGDPGRRAPVMVRVTTGVHAGGHEYIATAHEDQKFGLSVAGGQALAALEAVLDRPELELLGIHSHIGSQILDPAGFILAARTVLALRAQLAAVTGVLVEEVDLGGGFGVAYLPDEVPLDPARIAKDVAATVADACAELGTPRAAVLHRAGPVDRRADHPDALHRRHRQARHAGRRHGAHLRLGGRRDERQPAPGAVRRALPRRARVEDVGRRAGPGPGGGQALRERRHRGARRRAARRRRRRRPARGAGDRRLRALDGVELQRRAAAAGGRRGRRASRVLVRRETVDDLLALDLG